MCRAIKPFSEYFLTNIIGLRKQIDTQRSGGDYVDNVRVEFTHILKHQKQRNRKS